MNLSHYVVTITQKSLRKVTVDKMLSWNCTVYIYIYVIYTKLAIKVKEHWQISLTFITKAQEWHDKGLCGVFLFSARLAQWMSTCSKLTKNSFEQHSRSSVFIVELEQIFAKRDSHGAFLVNTDHGLPIRWRLSLQSKIKVFS